MAWKVFAVVDPLPANTTSTCQPLDVNVMGPLKSALRSTWAYRKSPKTAKEKRLDIIERTIIAWNSLDEDIVVESFENALPQHFEALEFL
ncbi:hypothetical protein PHYSODRAFT_514872 [Phytophthora sojae]|uniref:DDE-1 domain-containing protein n=1 Tax=Phytophthora sojae (strain P6497) TaxID=1094619 RepID=G4ZXU1_PHYSP|nr:hypothetical protein PHYSODRAFT_514872 [Phytophthora sojae]EGZ11899.1 hypothetical protein PHYSODRAFT_514872 [Phytophthora sojae]|eukprot:XP_009532232.1 hypothetical protein PHYSODRAFT_514872 [Phytophthora sojae]